MIFVQAFGQLESISMDNKSRIIALGTVLCLGAFSIYPLVHPASDAAMGQSPTPGAGQACKKTEVAGKCGTDFEVSTECGDSQCVLEHHVFGSITNCVGSQAAGLKDCASGYCKETIIRRTCNEARQCVVGNPSIHVNEVLPTSYSAGQPCGNSSGQDPDPVP